MKKSLANTICKLWNENFAGATPETKTRAVVVESGTGCAVEIVAVGDKNDGYSFHHIEHVVDIKRTFNVSAYVSQDEGKIYARIF